jgi:hypothetical protein
MARWMELALPVAAHPLFNPGEVAQCPAFAVQVAVLPDQLDGLLEMVDGLHIAALLGVEHADVGQSMGFASSITVVPGGVQGVGLHSEGVWEVPDNG